MWDKLRMKPEHLLWEEHYWAAGAKGKKALICLGGFLFCGEFLCLFFQILLPVKVKGL